MLGVSTSVPPLKPGCPQPMSSETNTTMLGGVSVSSTICAESWAGSPTTVRTKKVASIAALRRKRREHS